MVFVARIAQSTVIGASSAVRMEDSFVTTNSNVKLEGEDAPAVYAINSSWNSDLDTLIINATMEGIVAESSTISIRGLGKVEAAKEAIKAISNLGVMVDGEPHKSTEIVSLDDDALFVDGGPLVIRNIAKIEGSVNGAVLANLQKADIGYISTKVEGFIESSIELTSCNNVVIDSVTLVKGALYGILMTGSELEARHVTDKIQSTDGPAIQATDSVVEVFKCGEIKGGINGVELNSSQLNVKLVSRVEGEGEYGIIADTSTVLVEDIGEIFGGLDAVKTTSSAVKGLNIGIVTAGVNGFNHEAAIQVWEAVGSIDAGATGILVTSADSFILKGCGSVTGGAVGICLKQVQSSSIFKGGIISAPLAFSLVDSTCDAADSCAFEGVLAMQAYGSDLHSKYCTYTGLGNAMNSDITFEHGSMTLAFMATSSKITTRSFNFIETFTALSSDCDLSKTVVTLLTVLSGSNASLVDCTLTLGALLTSSVMSAKASSILVDLTTSLSAVDLFKTSVIGPVTLTSSTFNARQGACMNLAAMSSTIFTQNYTGALVEVITSTFKCHSGNYGNVAASSCDLEIGNSLLGNMVLLTCGVDINGSGIGTVSGSESGLTAKGCDFAAVGLTNSGIDLAGCIVPLAGAVNSGLTITGSTLEAANMSVNSGSVQSGSVVGANSVLVSGLLAAGGIAGQITNGGACGVYGASATIMGPIPPQTCDPIGIATAAMGKSTHTALLKYGMYVVGPLGLEGYAAEGRISFSTSFGYTQIASSLPTSSKSPLGNDHWGGVTAIPPIHLPG
jgi:hypothetical protein